MEQDKQEELKVMWGKGLVGIYEGDVLIILNKPNNSAHILAVVDPIPSTLPVLTQSDMDAIQAKYAKELQDLYIAPKEEYEQLFKSLLDKVVDEVHRVALSIPSFPIQYEQIPQEAIDAYKQEEITMKTLQELKKEPEVSHITQETSDGTGMTLVRI